jgi:hypothetical protein
MVAHPLAVAVQLTTSGSLGEDKQGCEVTDGPAFRFISSAQRGVVDQTAS